MSSRTQQGEGARRSIVPILEEFSGPNPYTSGGVLYASSILGSVDRVASLGPTTSGLSVVVVTGSITGNQFKAQFFTPGAISGSGFGEVASGTNLSAQAFIVLEEGNSSFM